MATTAPSNNSGKWYCYLSDQSEKSTWSSTLSHFSSNVILLCKQQCELYELVSKIHRSYGHFAREVSEGGSGTLERPLCCALNRWRILSIAVDEDHRASQYSHQRWWGAAAATETPFGSLDGSQPLIWPGRLQNTCLIAGERHILH